MAAPISTTYSPQAREQIAQHCLSEIAKGRALSRILLEDDGMCGITAFWNWMDADPVLAAKVERAREIGATTILEEIVDIADESGGDAYLTFDQHGNPQAKIDGEAIQRSKLRVYAREKYAQMIAPRRFGNKVDVTSGNEPLKPAQLNDNRIQTLVDVALSRRAKAIEDQGE